jgi:uncharacterized protein YndB with AHSA1/START domain
VSAVIVSLRVEATPEEAFDVFTQEIGAWWKPNGLFQLTPRGDGVLSFEPGETGRLITTLPNGHVFEIGRITAWAPGERLAFTWRQATFAAEQQTTVEVRFEPVDGGTRVTVEHRGWDAIPVEHVARHGFPLNVFQMRQGEHWRALLASMAGQVGAR